MPTNADLAAECDRVQRIVGGPNDALSRQRLGEYAADLIEAQQKQGPVDQKLNRQTFRW